MITCGIYSQNGVGSDEMGYQRLGLTQLGLSHGKLGEHSETLWDNQYRICC